MKGAVAVGVVLGLLFSFICVALTGGHTDNIGGPVMALVAVLVVVLAVGLVERWTDHTGEKP